MPNKKGGHLEAGDANRLKEKKEAERKEVEYKTGKK